MHQWTMGELATRRLYVSTVRWWMDKFNVYVAARFFHEKQLKSIFCICCDLVTKCVKILHRLYLFGFSFPVRLFFLPIFSTLPYKSIVCVGQPECKRCHALAKGHRGLNYNDRPTGGCNWCLVTLQMSETWKWIYWPVSNKTTGLEWNILVLRLGYGE